MISPYREFQPHPALAPYVACYWGITSPLPLVNRVLPDGCTDIVVSDTLEVIGTMRQAVCVPVDAGSITIGVRFKPGGGAAFFRLPLHELTDSSLELRALWGRSAGELADQQAGAITLHDKIARLEACLLSRLDRLPALDTTLQTALTAVQDTRGAISITDLRTSLALSERQLERIFHHHTGLSPRQFVRLTRFRHGLALLRQPARSLTNVAHHAGYYDQAHFIHDFKALAGITPRDYRREQQDVGFLQFTALTI